MKINELQPTATNVAIIANQPIAIKKKSDPVDTAFRHSVLGFKYTSKVTSLFKSSVKVSEAFTKIPGQIDEVITALSSFKIIKGMLSIEKFMKSILKVCRPGDLKKRLFAGWSVIKCTKSMVGAVETVFKYLKKLQIIPKSALAWATITGYIFLPIKFISAALSVYKTSEKVLFMRGFRSRIALCKQPGADRVDNATRVCKQLLIEEKQLKKVKVISKEASLKPRLKNIISDLNNENSEIRQKAAAESKCIATCLKNRVRERVAVAAVKTSLKTVGCACKIVGMTCPPAEIPLLIIKLALKVTSFGALCYSNFIPKGEITWNEKPMFFALQFKTMRRMQKALQVALAKIHIPINQPKINLAK